jgi:flavin-dependent dehydrogenase
MLHERTFEYAVVGAGPAGALAAATLAEKGRAVALFDWAPRAEKACGGGVPARGMRRFGSLVDGVPRNRVRTIRVIAPGGARAEIALEEPLSIFARRDFDEELRRLAERRGARRIAARVVGLERAGSRDRGFELSFRRTADGPVERCAARFVVAADGAAGLARKRLLELAGAEPPGPGHFSLSSTIYPAHGAPGGRPLAERGVLEIAWFRGVDGYGWVFPREDHASIGGCVQAPAGSAAPRAAVGGYGEGGVGALIPSFRGEAAARSLVEGDGFALVGDAAGAVDPITREGIHHALATGAAIGEQDPLARPGAYAKWYDAEIRPELVTGARMAKRFFAPRFLDSMVGALEESEALRAVFRDLVAGAQPYRGLKRRLLRCLPRMPPTLLLATLLPR